MKIYYKDIAKSKDHKNFKKLIDEQCQKEGININDIKSGKIVFKSARYGAEGYFETCLPSEETPESKLIKVALKD